MLTLTVDNLGRKPGLLYPVFVCVFTPGAEHNAGVGGDSRYRVLLMRPNPLLHGKGESDGYGHNVGGGTRGSSSRTVASVKTGEGPWVGCVGSGGTREVTSHFVYVALDKVGVRFFTCWGIAVCI